MVLVRVAHIRDGRDWWVIVPLAPSFGHCSADEQQKILAALTESVHHAKTMRMIGVVIIAWRDGNELKFAAPPAYPGPLPSITSMELFSRMTHQIQCEDPLVLAQLSGHHYD